MDQNKRTANGLNVSLGSSEWAVRLVDPYENVLPSSGIVQVFLNGSWGDICFSNWDRRDADVACRGLGFSGSFYATNVDDYKPASPNVLFDVGCSGYESSFAECNYSRTNAPKECRVSLKASATCTNFTIRLTGGRYPWAGVVEVFYNDSWRPVCNDHWDINDGHVVCKYLGIGRALDTDQHPNDASNIKRLAEEYMIDGIHCRGNESSILECPWYNPQPCNSTQFAMVRCSNGNEIIYLTDGNSSLDGVVMYYYNGRQRSVCVNFWNRNNADVVCRSLELGRALHIPVYHHISDGSHDGVTLDRVECTGNESRLFDCPGVGIGSENECNVSEVSRVICSGGEGDH
ncbi:scavenger receptor cysteine-rich domain superfamily protein-like [Lytechinus variegatus]|uniref:scavenger receptor cysteine-rich domain superfamily protein-like n=1 Tax=Lytechinus variegatus TaxID=7654 RepID=UPI001BB2CD21|nr:scavenger receptor cysteine-rich domain superfamily protein-like [Lytechinus variegatus]